MQTSLQWGLIFTQKRDSRAPGATGLTSSWKSPGGTSLRAFSEKSTSLRWFFQKTAILSGRPSRALCDARQHFWPFAEKEKEVQVSFLNAAVRMRKTFPM